MGTPEIVNRGRTFATSGAELNALHTYLTEAIVCLDDDARITEPAFFSTYLPFGFGAGASLVSLGEG